MSRIVKIIYFVLFAVLIVQPHIIRGHLFSLSSPFIQNIVTVLVMGVAWLTYRLHVMELRKREREKVRLQEHLQQLDGRLLEAAKYIGLVNVRLPLLKTLTSSLLRREKVTRRQKVAIFEQLLGIAAISISKTKWGLFRFINPRNARTTHEFFHSEEAWPAQTNGLSNKAILQALAAGNTLAHANIDIIGSSDVQAPERGVLLLPTGGAVSDEEKIVLQVIVDQAQLFHQYLFH